MVLAATVALGCDFESANETTIAQLARADPSVATVDVITDWLDGTEISITLIESAGRSEAQGLFCRLSPLISDSEPSTLSFSNSQGQWVNVDDRCPPANSGTLRYGRFT